MSEKSILIGNGINIAFSENDDYKNYKIIERLLVNINNGRFDKVFNNTVKASELEAIIIGLNTEFKKMLKGVGALKWTENEDEMKTLIDIAKRYNGKSQELLDVGMEDYFFVMKLFNNSYGADAVPIKLLFDGLKYLFLDSIFNDGQIEKNYLKMDCLRKELSKYSNIFTVNYDTNLDKLTPNIVYHIHGSFNILDDTYRPETVAGLVAQTRPNPPKVIPGLEHLYCNAIMGFSGVYKMDRMEKYAEINNISPTSKIKATEYPLKEFKNIEGELYILGMSPNNDSHIFNMINKNSKLSRVIYYSASDDDTTSAQKVIEKPIEIRNVFNYWNNIRKI